MISFGYFRKKSSTVVLLGTLGVFDFFAHTYDQKTLHCCFTEISAWTQIQF
jgi:hypothetical protein